MLSPTAAPPSTASSSLKAGDTISGVYDWTVKTTGNCAKVEYWATPSGQSPVKLGEVAGTSGTYVFHFDTTIAPERRLPVRRRRGRARRHPLQGRQPRDRHRSPTDRVPVASSIHDGDTLSGKVPWTLDAAGLSVSKVDFFVDGSLKWTENLAPYVFNGDGNTLDTTTLSDGSHVFAVKVTTSTGGVLAASATAKVANTTATTPPPPPPPPPSVQLAVSSSISDGQVLAGKVSWTASTTGTVSKVEFSIDGSTSWTENLAPYVFNGDGNQLDTTTIRNGKHVLSVKAFGTDGSTATASATVKFRN